MRELNAATVATAVYAVYTQYILFNTWKYTPFLQMYSIQYPVFEISIFQYILSIYTQYTQIRVASRQQQYILKSV